MAEALLGVGVAANIIQLVDFGSRLVVNLKDCISSLDGVPQSFQHISKQLPVQLNLLKQSSEVIRSDFSLDSDVKNAIEGAVTSCTAQLKLLETIMDKVLPKPGESRFKRGRLALKMTLKYDAQVQSIASTVRGYIADITSYHATSTHGKLTTLRFSPRKLSPSIGLPFPRDKNFVDRKELMDQVSDMLSTAPARAALVGIGGIGKSQLAIEYAYRCHDESPETWVFWLHGGSKSGFEESCQKLAWKLELYQNPSSVAPDNTPSNTLELLLRWFEDSRNGDWLVVLDNVDDITVFASSDKSSRGGAHTAKPLAAYLPQSSHGRILVTSRNQDAASSLVGDLNIIEVGALSEEEASSLFQRNRTHKESIEDTKDLIRALDYIPLAISQAAAYINRWKALGSALRYLENYKRSEQDKESLLCFDGGNLRRDHTAQNSIIITWQLSYEQIVLERSTAADLLSLMSFLHWQDIPELVLRERIWPFSESSSYREIAKVDLEEDIAVLLSYGLVKCSSRQGYLEMHPLVQFATKTWLKSKKQFDFFADQFERIISSIPSLRYREYPAKDQFLEAFTSHVLIASRHEVSTADSRRHLALLLNAGADQFFEERQYDKQEALARKAVKAIEESPSNQNPVDGFRCRETLYRALWNQHRVEEAEQVLQVALEKYNIRLHYVDADIFQGTRNAAKRLSRLKDYEKAEAIYRRRLEARREYPTACEYMEAIEDLATFLVEQGKLDDALAVLHHEYADFATRNSSFDRFLTERSEEMLYKALETQGPRRLAKMEKTIMQAIRKNENEHGKRHTRTIQAIAICYKLMMRQEKYGEADTLMRLLAIREYGEYTYVRMQMGNSLNSSVDDVDEE